MHWFLYILLSLPVALLGLVGGGFIGNAVVRWYHVSSFEGGSGYAVIAWGLMGGVAGLVTGLVTFGVMAPHDGAGYLKTLGAAVGVLVGLAGLVTALGWGLADIPPTIDGRPLRLEVELRLPVGVTNSPAKGSGESKLELYSVVNHTGRKHEVGTLRPKDARQEGGRWIVPGEVEVFTMRGRRSLSILLNGEEVQGYLVPLPARPGKKYLEWSDWGPRPPAPLPPWPDSKPSYRFRVQLIPEPPPAPTQAEIQAEHAADEQAKFAAIPSDSPIPAWFPYVYPGAPEPRRSQALQKLTAKPGYLAELQALMLGAQAEHAASAMRLVEYLPNPGAELVTAVQLTGQDLIRRMPRVNALTVEEDPSYDQAAEISVRFSAWTVAASDLRTRAGGDFTPELAEILKLSRVRTDSRAMQGDVCRVASYYLKEWAGVAPLPTDPPPK
jgi:hypothetical protein